MYIIMFQVTDSTTYMPPEVEPVNTSDGPICAVPEGIRPVMKKHRIEVCVKHFLIFLACSYCE